MSGSSVNTILDEPQKSIGAQDIQKVGHCSKTGFLRKQERLQRILKFLRWPQRFIVVSRGCIYIYKDEFATSPKKAVSLRLYNQVKRSDVSTPVWAFILLPVDPNRSKSMFFSCTSDEIRKEWMRDMRENMEKVHKVSISPGDIDDYVYLEKEVISREKTQQHQQQQKQQTQKTADASGQDDDIEEDYSTIDDMDVNQASTSNGAKRKAKRPTFKPAPPKESYTPVDMSQKSKPKFRTPPPSPKNEQTQTPKSKPSSLDRSQSYSYDGTDREEVEKILTMRPEGTYLVRKSRKDNKQVLSVNVEGILKEFKIYDKEGKVTLDNDEYFSDLDELIDAYTDRNLPKKDTKLYRAFSVTDTGYVN